MVDSTVYYFKSRLPLLVNNSCVLYTKSPVEKLSEANSSELVFESSSPIDPGLLNGFASSPAFESKLKLCGGRVDCCVDFIEKTLELFKRVASVAK